MYLLYVALMPQADEAQQVIDGWSQLGPGYATASALTVIIGLALAWEIKRLHSQIDDLVKEKSELNHYIRETSTDHVKAIQESIHLLRAVAEDTEGLSEEIREVLSQYDRRLEVLLQQLNNRNG